MGMLILCDAMRRFDSVGTSCVCVCVLHCVPTLLFSPVNFKSHLSLLDTLYFVLSTGSLGESFCPLPEHLEGG